MPATAYDPDTLTRIVMLVYGTTLEGKAYWCYVAVKPARYDEFQRVWQSHSLNLQNFESDGYGEVIVSGEGVIPPTQITRKVAVMFNADINKLFAVDDPKAMIDKEIEALRLKAEQAS